MTGGNPNERLLRFLQATPEQQTVGRKRRIKRGKGE